MPQRDDNGVVTAAAVGLRPTLPQLNPPTTFNLNPFFSHFPLDMVIIYSQKYSGQSGFLAQKIFFPNVRRNHITNLQLHVLSFQFFAHLFIFPPLSFSTSFLSNILQAQNCSQEGDYGRQKSSHYLGRLYREATLCLSRKLQLPAVPKCTQNPKVSISTDFYTTYNRQYPQYPKVSKRTQKYLEAGDCGQSHLPGAFLP